MNPPVQASTIDIKTDGGRFSLEATDADIGDVLKTLAGKANIRIDVAPGVNERVTVKIADLALEELLKQLCANRAIVYQYMPETQTYRILQAGAYAAAPGAQAPAAKNAKATGTSVSQGPAATGPGVRPTGGAAADENPVDSQGRLLYKPRELLVRFKAGITDAQKKALHDSVGAVVLKRLAKQQIDRIQLPDGMNIAQGLERYSASEIVAHVERHALRYALLTPNETAYASQWAPPKIKFPDAWSVSTGSPRVIVAVIDTGIDYNHPDLSANIWTNPGEIPGNSIDDEGNGLIDDVRGWDYAGTSKYTSTDGDANPADVDGHGTHVAGIIAATGNNNLGIAGASWSARLMALKVQADNGTTMAEIDIIQSIDYAIAKGARIVNCSFGGEAYSQEEYDAFARLRAAGILAVCAAGNDGVNIDPGTGSKCYPASYTLDNIIAVAASDQNDNLWSTSNYGAQSVHLMAPGVSVYSTCLSNSYCYKSGTSMATPHVAGVAALLLAKAPALTYAQVKAAILNNVDPVASVYTKLISGGRLNAAAALAAVRSPGDLNNDGHIDLADAVLALRILSGLLVTVSPGPLSLQADVNGDGKIGLEEALYALQRAASIRTDNREPVLAPIGDRTVDENSTLNFSMQATDPDQDSLTYAAENLPTGAQFTSANRTFTWTPTYSQSGVYSVTFSVSDAYGGQDRQTITITVYDRTPVFAIGDYFPLHNGDWWDYNDGTAVFKRTTIIGTKTINSAQTMVMSYSDGRKDYYRLDGTGLMMYGQYVLTDNYTGEVIFDSPIVILRNDAYPGMMQSSTTSYAITVSGYLFHVDLTSTTTVTGVEDLTIGGTLLPNCITVTSQINQTIRETGQILPGPLNHYWFARGIGKVKSDTETIISATINGETKTF